MHAIWHGMLHTLGRFDVSVLTEAEIANYDGVWTLFVAMTRLVLTRVVDPATAQQIVGMITGSSWVRSYIVR